MHSSIKRAFAKKSTTFKVNRKEMSEVKSSSVQPPKSFYQEVKSEKHGPHPPSEHSWRSSKASFSSDTTLADPEPLGLNLLYPTAWQSKTQCFEYASKLDEVDIVAIHDLGGPYHSSWTHENGSLWLRDLLPDAFPRSRIYSYSYRAEVFFTDPDLELQACADELLEALSEARGEKVCHTCDRYSETDR